MSDKTPKLRSEIAQNLDLEQVRYSQVWEDHRLLEEGLGIETGDHVLSIGSAGCNALALLLAGAEQVTAIDMSPAQNALFELKIAGIRQLDHAEFAIFWGAREGDRMALYPRVCAVLPPAAVAFWDARRPLIESGVLHCGRFDTYLRAFHERFLPNAWTSGTAERLLSAESLEHQRRIYESECDTPQFRELVHWYAGRKMLALTGRDEAQLKYAAIDDIGAHFLERFRHSLTRVPARGNHYLEYNLTGQYRDLTQGPTFLRPQAFQTLKERLDRIEIVEGELETFLLSRPKAAFNKVNLSDVFEYMSADHSEQMFLLLADRLPAGGRIAYWNLLVPRRPSQALSARLRPLDTVAHALWLRDRAWFYRSFHIDEVMAQN